MPASGHTKVQRNSKVPPPPPTTDNFSGNVTRRWTRCQVTSQVKTVQRLPGHVQSTSRWTMDSRCNEVLACHKRPRDIEKNKDAKVKALTLFYGALFLPLTPIVHRTDSWQASTHNYFHDLYEEKKKEFRSDASNSWLGKGSYIKVPGNETWPFGALNLLTPPNLILICINAEWSHSKRRCFGGLINGSDQLTPVSASGEQKREIRPCRGRALFPTRQSLQRLTRIRCWFWGSSFMHDSRFNDSGLKSVTGDEAK